MVLKSISRVSGDTLWYSRAFRELVEIHYGTQEHLES